MSKRVVDESFEMMAVKLSYTSRGAVKEVAQEQGINPGRLR